jgi:hypothetical protein
LLFPIHFSRPANSLSHFTLTNVPDLPARTMEDGMFGQEQQGRLLSGRACCSRGVGGQAGRSLGQGAAQCGSFGLGAEGLYGEDRPALSAFSLAEEGRLAAWSDVSGGN